MKIAIKTWSPLLLLVVMFACSTTKGKVTSTTEDASHLTVTFFSKGEGIDRKAYAAFKSLLDSKYPDLKYSEEKYGREGEKDFCFDLSSLKKHDKEKFIQSVEDITSSSETIRLKEHSTCTNNR